MRGLICFSSLILLIMCIEVIPVWTSLLLIAIFFITSIKYWDKESKKAVWDFFNKKDISRNH